MENLAPEQECHNTSTGVRELCIRKFQCRLKEGLKEAMYELELKNRIEISRGREGARGTSAWHRYQHVQTLKEAMSNRSLSGR